MKIIEAKEGMWLTNGNTFSQKIYLPDNVDDSCWRQISNSEKIKRESEEGFISGSIGNAIERLKDKLQEGDYKVIKCVERMLKGIEMPYDINQLIKERNEIRDEINYLQQIDENTL